MDGTVEQRDMVPLDQARAAQRAGKMRDFRQYLVDSGAVDSAVRMMVSLLEEPQLPLDSPTILQDFYGHYRDPQWDDIEELEASSKSLREANVQLEDKLLKLEQELEQKKAAKAAEEAPPAAE